MRVPLIAAAAAAIVGICVCTPAAQSHPSGTGLRRPTSSADALASGALITARAGLDNKLLDYPSARFRQMRLVRLDGGLLAFCGQINARTGAGGYSGWTPVVIVDQKPADAVIIQTPEFGDYPTQTCATAQPVNLTDYSAQLKAVS